MSTKSMFSKEEWQLLADGPEWIFAAISAADGDAAFAQKMKETAAFMKVVSSYTTTSELVKEVIADKVTPAKEVKGASLLKCVDQLEKINDVLAEKIEIKEADAYRKFLKDVGNSVAQAVGENLFGSKIKLSVKEVKALDKIKAALKSVPSKVEAEKKTSSRIAELKKKTSAAAKKPSQHVRTKRTEGVVPQKRAVPAAPKKEYIAEHTVEAGETLSHISLKYYNSAVKPKYMLIYEENKAIIGDNPNVIRPGQVLKIPKLEG